MLDGKPVATGEPIAGKDLPRLELDVPKGSGAQEEVDMLAYATRDNWGGESQGILVFRVKNGEGAEGQQLVASLEAGGRTTGAMEAGFSWDERAGAIAQRMKSMSARARGTPVSPLQMAGAEHE